MNYLLFGLVGLIAWTARGQYGGYEGGFLVGALLGLTLSVTYTLDKSHWNALGLATLLDALALYLFLMAWTVGRRLRNS